MNVLDTDRPRQYSFKLQKVVDKSILSEQEGTKSTKDDMIGVVYVNIGKVAYTSLL